MEDYNYTLIISQYWHSYHYFIVKFNKETFIKHMQELTIELDNHKGNGINDKHAITQSDPFYEYKDNDIHRRYNVNGNGDIYFLNSKYVDYLQGEIRGYEDTARQGARGYKRKSVIEDISKNHNKNKVYEIIKKHFEIA